MKPNLISKTFREARLKQGLNQGQLAQKLGYTSPQIVSNWERGLTTPPVKRLKKLCKVLKLKHGVIVEMFVDEYRKTLLG